MELDTKQKVLVAIYTEYQKDIPDMEGAISSKVIGIDSNAFKNGKWVMGNGDRFIFPPFSYISIVTPFWLLGII